MKNINSHIQIPNAVLKQFRDEKDPEKKVWYLDLATGEVKRSASGKLGTEKGYYSEGIEQFWSATIESPIAALNARIRKFCDGCEGNIGDFLLSEKDKTAVKRYIKAMAIRSNLAYESMLESSLTADECTTQENHDDLSRFGMEVTGQFEEILGRLDVFRQRLMALDLADDRQRVDRPAGGLRGGRAEIDQLLPRLFFFFRFAHVPCSCL